MSVLKLDRADVSQSRVQAFAVVDFIDHASEIRPDFCNVAIAASIPLLLFELADEALAKGMVVRVPRTTHADLSSVLFEQREVVAASVLHTTVRVMDPAWLRTALVERCPQGSRRQLGGDIFLQRPAHYASRPDVKHLGTLATPEDRVLAIGCCNAYYYPTSWHFDCADTSSPGQTPDTVAHMLSTTDYDYVIGPDGFLTRILGPEVEAILLYKDRSCAVRRFTTTAEHGDSSPEQ